MDYAFFNHQDKGNKYIEALDREYNRINFILGDHPPVDFVFSDHDILGRAVQLERFRNKKARWFFIHPHGGRPNLSNDVFEPYHATTCAFVHTPEHKKIMQAFDYPREIHSVGWSLCPIAPMRKTGRVKNVLFAPIHPRCARVDKDLNYEVYHRLAELADTGAIRLTVRYIRNLQEVGLQRLDYKHISYVKGELTPCWQQIDNADVVVGHQTFLYLAVARGCPTLGFGTRLVSHIIPGQRVLYAKNWGKYEHMLKYPLDILDDKPLTMLKRAANEDEPQLEWKSRMIGEKEFDGDKLLSIVKGYVTT